MIVTVIQTTIPRRRKQKKPVLNVPGKVAIYNGIGLRLSLIVNKIYNVIHSRYP